MLRVEQVGGLAVAFNEASRETIERELKQLDPNLFLDFETNGRYVYPVVMEWIGERHNPPAICLLEWRDVKGGPRPLSGAIVEQVKRMERKDDRLMERVNAANRRLEERAEADADAQYDDVTRAFDRAARNGGHFSGPVHRSRGLYLSRSKARSAGKAR